MVAVSTFCVGNLAIDTSRMPRRRTLGNIRQITAYSGERVLGTIAPLLLLLERLDIFAVSAAFSGGMAREAHRVVRLLGRCCVVGTTNARSTGNQDRGLAH